MVDYFALALTHGLLALAAWRLLSRADLDEDRDDDRPDAATQRRFSGRQGRARRNRGEPHA